MQIFLFLRYLANLSVQQKGGVWNYNIFMIKITFKTLYFFSDLCKVYVNLFCFSETTSYLEIPASNF